MGIHLWESKAISCDLKIYCNRFDWCESLTDVFIDVLVKNVTEQDAKVNFLDNNVSVSVCEVLLIALAGY